MGTERLCEREELGLGGLQHLGSRHVSVGQSHVKGRATLAVDSLGRGAVKQEKGRNNRKTQRSTAVQRRITRVCRYRDVGNAAGQHHLVPSVEKRKI